MVKIEVRHYLNFNEYLNMLTRIANSLSIVATVVVIFAVIWLGLRGGILGVGPVSFSVQALGLLLVAWARLAFGIRSFHFAARPTQGGLVTSGPYRYIRNPIYSGAIVIILTGVAVHFSWGNVALGLLAISALLTRMICEEQLLPQIYPEYLSYAAKTPPLIPFVI